MKLKNKAKKALGVLLAATMLSTVAASAVSAIGNDVAGTADFASKLESQYTDPDRVYSTEVRWWIGEASNTDEALLEEIQALYDAGFRGVELCMQSDKNAPDDTYAYGSDMWSHKWKLMMNKILDLGMTLSLTSGTNWSTSNVPGLDPDSQQASQVVAMGSQVVKAGESITALPKPSTQRESNKGKFVAAYAGKLASTDGTSYVVEPGSMIDLSNQVTAVEGATVYDQAINWTAPADSDYVVFGYWTHGNYKTASPAAETCYATNYFDTRGVDALQSFWEEHYLNDPELNEKIKEGDVQLFMDSIELNPDGGITWWTEDIRQEFINRKGYDVMPYLFLVAGLPQVQAVHDPYYPPAEGTHDLENDKNTREKIINDWVDVLTQLYCENMLQPLKDWLNSVGIETRAQISYGRSFEITEPAMYVDYPEAESLNQYNQVDILRLHSAGNHLLDKVLSSETGTELNTYYTPQQLRLEDAYTMFASGFQRLIWHIWSAGYSYGENAAWPGWGSGFDRWGTREPSYKDFDEFNAHLGRVQQMLQTGISRTDVGFIHNNWNQGVRFGGESGDGLTGMQYMLAHQGVYYRSTELQDNGYTYDYFSPDMLKAEGVYFDEDTKTIEPAGYKALVLYQDWLDIDGAKLIYEWAQKGLPVFIMEGAAERTTFNDGKDEELASIMEQMRALPNVKDVEIYDASEDFDYFDKVAEGYDDGLYDAMQEMGIRPYAEFNGANHQLLTQTREAEDGSRYLYAYNYCSNDYHENSFIDEVKTEDHGTNIKTEIRMDGMYIPYTIDSWTGEVTEIGNYYYEDGQTVFPIDLDYDDIALYAFEPVTEESFHATSTNADMAYGTENGVAVRATQSGTYTTKLSSGRTVTEEINVPESYPITNWDVTVESWTPSENILRSEETIGDVHTVNTKVDTDKTDINVKLDELTTWNNIPEVGETVSGIGYYNAKFNWDSSSADGAYIDFGDEFYSSMKVWINGQKVGGDVSANPTKAPKSILENYEGTEQYTGGISSTDPVADISKYLVDGENTIYIEYSSPLGNVQLSRGAIKPGGNSRNKWFGELRQTKYLPYGPSQAVIVPFVDSVYEVAAKDILNTVIDYAEQQKASDEFNNVIADVQKTFNAALDAAKAVAADPAATQDAVDAAWKTLMTEIHKLGFVKGNITSLETLVALAEGYDMNDYVEAGQAEFKEALAAAQAILADKDNAMQAEIETAETNLLNAMLNLRYKADKSILESVLAEANGKDASAYTAESYAVLTAAVAEANDVMADENATQEEVDAAVTNVQAAMDQLVAVDGRVPEETTPSTDDTATQTGEESTTPKANAAKTGDFAPIAGLAAITLAGAALLFTRKKR